MQTSPVDQLVTWWSIEPDIKVQWSSWSGQAGFWRDSLEQAWQGEQDGFARLAALQMRA